MKFDAIFSPRDGGETMAHERRPHLLRATGRASALQRVSKCVARYRGDSSPRGFSCWDQYLAMAFAQLTYRESLRDREACLDVMRLEVQAQIGPHCTIIAHFSVRSRRVGALQFHRRWAGDRHSPPDIPWAATDSQAPRKILDSWMVFAKTTTPIRWGLWPEPRFFYVME